MTSSRFELVSRSLEAGRLSRRAALGRLGRGSLAASVLAGSALSAPRLVGAQDDGAHGHDGAGSEQDAAIQDMLVPMATRDTLPESDADTAGRLRRLTDYDRGLWLDVGDGWTGLGRDLFDVRAFGAVGDGQTDDWAAFNSAIEAMVSPLSADSTTAAGRTLFVPPGTYRLAQSLVLNRSVRLLGADGEGSRGDSVLRFDPGIFGIVVEANDPSRTGPEGRRAEGATIERLRIEVDTALDRGGAVAVSEGDGGAAATAGVLLLSRATLRGCHIEGFGGDGIRVEAPQLEGAVTTGAEVDGWEIDGCQVEGCGGHGLSVAGAAAGVCSLLTAIGNGGWGILDAGTRGNTYVQCRATDNGSGPFSSTGAGNRGLFLGCASGAGTEGSAFADETIVVGGDHLADYRGGNAWTATGSRVSLLAQTPGTGDLPLATVPTLRLTGVADDGGVRLEELDVAGRLFLGPVVAPDAVGGSPQAGLSLLHLSGPGDGRVGIRWITAGDGVDGWVAQARAYRDPAGPDVVGGGGSRLTFQTAADTGAEIDTLTLRAGQVGVGTLAPLPAAALEIAATNRGFLPPRLTTDQRNAIVAPPEGLTVYDTTAQRLAFFGAGEWRLVAVEATEGDGATETGG